MKVPIHSSPLEIFIAVMELSKEQMPEMWFCKTYLTHQGISGRDRKTCSCSEMLCNLSCIPANCITLHFFFPPLIYWMFYSTYWFPCIWGGKCYITASVDNKWVGFFEHQIMWISAVKNKVGGRFSWDKYQFSNLKGNVKKKAKTKQQTSLSRWWICFYIFLSYLCTKK